jgi:hypothetical protein
MDHVEQRNPPNNGEPFSGSRSRAAAGLIRDPDEPETGRRAPLGPGMRGRDQALKGGCEAGRVRPCSRGRLPLCVYEAKLSVRVRER